ncbi:hypothetical protein LCGC14_2080860 [marine sediment metagenome]|uniref:Uncharacterized protein n=1 Tax=marine sediment metagenome TaxID=412755 RepID=A0A0F9EFK0_9ZZZZ
MDNIYIEILRYGSERINQGVTFNQVLNHLKEKGFQIDGLYKNYLGIWFFTNFYSHPASHSAFKIVRGELAADQMNLIYFDGICRMTGDAYMNYMDYVELKEAREASSKAHAASRKAIRIAIWALSISGILALGSLIFQALGYFVI